MRMTEQEFRDEYQYSVIMMQYKRMLKLGLITLEDYGQFKKKYLGVFHPVTAGLLVDSDLTLSQRRALMLTGKEAVKCPR